MLPVSYETQEYQEEIAAMHCFVSHLHYYDQTSLLT